MIRTLVALAVLGVLLPVAATAGPIQAAATIEEYFRLEETSPIRHEYVSGEVYAMSGATARHNRIAGNIFARLLPVARAGPCDVFMNDMRLEAASQRYYYPDVMVVCTPIGTWTWWLEVRAWSSR